jgi:hypothetical protein
MHFVRGLIAVKRQWLKCKFVTWGVTRAAARKRQGLGPCNRLQGTRNLPEPAFRRYTVIPRSVYTTFDLVSVVQALREDQRGHARVDRQPRLGTGQSVAGDWGGGSSLMRCPACLSSFPGCLTICFALAMSAARGCLMGRLPGSGGLTHG